MIRVMLADDHEVVRVGFRMILEQDPDVRGGTEERRVGEECRTRGAPDH